MLILLITLCSVVRQSCNYRRMYHAGNHKKIQNNKNTFWYNRISIVAQTKIIIQQIAVILSKSNFHEIRVIGLPCNSKEKKKVSLIRKYNLVNKMC